MKEIGSEFEWHNPKNLQNGLSWFPTCEDWSLTFSGRTAFETVIADIGDIKKVYFPSYCCDSMIDPFRKKGIAIEFYRIDYSDEFNVLMNIPEDCDVLVVCNYFGYRVNYPRDEIEKFKIRGGVVIEDITHSLFSEVKSELYSDYLVASIRKWGPILCGGLCCKRIGKIENKPSQYPDEAFLELKAAAMKKKYDYINQLSDGKKEDFLNMYNESNRFFSCNYEGREIDTASREMLYSWNFEEIRSRRRRNATVLHNELHSVDWCSPIFELNDTDCPLFVPVVVHGGKRDCLRQELIKNSIYCPVHWPKPKVICKSNLYDMELSLVCDQRYDANDMLRVANVIKKYKG